MEHRTDSRYFALAVSAAYLIAGLIWIQFSDRLGPALFATPEAVENFQRYKGSAFIIASAALLFFLLARGAGRAPRLPGRGLPLVVSLVVMVLATALPLFALLGYNMVREATRATREADALVTKVAAGTASDVKRFFAARHRMVSALAQQSLLEGAGAPACKTILLAISSLHQSRAPVSIVRGDGKVLCGGQPAIEAMPAIREGLAQAADPVIGSPQHDGREWSFPVTYPVPHPAEGGVTAVRAFIASARLAALIRAPLPQGGSTALVDSSGFVLASSRDAGLVGTRVTDLERLRQMAGRPQVSRGSDGVERVYAVQAIEGLGLFAVAGIASEHVYGPARENTWRSAGVGLLVLLLAGLLIARLGRNLTTSMRALSGTAERVAQGQRDARAPEAGPAEVARVAVEFNRMLDRLPELEHALHATEQRNRELLEKLLRNVPGMIFQFRVGPDGVGTVPFASHGIEQLFEATADEARSNARVIHDCLHPEERPRVLALTLESLRTMSHFAAEYRVQLPTRGERHYLTHSQPELQADGSVLWYGCTVDVTDLKRTQDELKGLNEQLEGRVDQRTAQLAEANAALESFSYSIAHDLRAPLATIAGFAGALPSALEQAQPERVAHLVGRITANTRKMGLMIEALLALARTSHGPLQDRPTQLRELAMGVLAESAFPPNVRVEVGDLPAALVDGPLFRQVFWNLLSNAVKFSSKTPQPRVEVTCETRDDALVVCVKDNGAGFDPADAERIFEPFLRLHAQADFEGTGIGLAIVRRAVESHGGRVWAHGSAGEGAAVCFTIPGHRMLRPQAA